MGCVTSVSFDVIVNGFLMEFFQDERGLRQGFPLSTFSFLLVIEGMSISLLKSKVLCSIKGIKICKNLHVTHLMFVDDNMILGYGSILEWS